MKLKPSIIVRVEVKRPDYTIYGAISTGGVIARPVTHMSIMVEEESKCVMNGKIIMKCSKIGQNLMDMKIHYQLIG